MEKLIHNISLATTLNESDLEYVEQAALYCISDDIYKALKDIDESKMANGIVEVDIGIGNLVVDYNPSQEISFKFIPSKPFVTIIRDSIEKDRAPLAHKLSENISNRILKTYKDLL